MWPRARAPCIPRGARVRAPVENLGRRKKVAAVFGVTSDARVGYTGALHD